MQRSQQLRTATQTRRSARAGFPEPDDFEGLPVRQWRQEWVSVAPSSQQEMTQQGDRWAVELPYGMPRESHLLPPHTQELLRAARSGRLYKRPAPTEEEEPDAEVDAVKGEKKDWEPTSDGYTVKMWKQVPRNAENQTISHLAKRHKNTVTLASRAAAPQAAGPTVTRATVRRIDAAGNPYEQTVTLADGQQVDGEIISTTVVPAPTAAQGELGVQQTTPARRRPPPPKRKAKGPGRGRKKGKLPIPIPATRSQATADGTLDVKPETIGPDGIKIEDTEDSANQDSEMADISGMPSEDEEGEGGEGEEEEEGDEEAGDDEGAETPNVEDASGEARDAEAEDAEMTEAIQPSSVEEPDEPRPVAEEVEEVEVTMPKVRFQPPTLANLGPPHAAAQGSPLKNVMVLSPTEPSPVISSSGNTPFAASNYLEVQSRTVSMDMGRGSISQAYAAETTTQSILPPLREHATHRHVANHSVAAPPTLPAKVSPPAPAVKPAETTADKPQPATELQPTPPKTAKTPSPPAETETPAEAEPAPTAQTSDPTDPTDPTGDSTIPEASLQPPTDAPAIPAATTDAEEADEAAEPATGGDDNVEEEEEEDDGLNLLGSLERELDRQEGMSSDSSSGGGLDGKDGKDGIDGAAAVKVEEAAAGVDGEGAAAGAGVGDADAGVYGKVSGGNGVGAGEGASS